MTSNTFSKHDQDFADAMATKLRLNREKYKRNLTADEKINQLNAKQKQVYKLGRNIFPNFIFIN